jgi:hypothetical protein
MTLATGLTAPPYTLDEAELRPARKKPVQREWRAQEADNAFLSRALPEGAYYTAIDGGRAENARIGAARKRRGIKAGLPDFLVVYCGITLWIERKAGSSLSEHQRITRDALIRNGHRWALAKSTEDIEIACREAGIPLRATFGGIVERIAAQRERVGAPKKRAARKIKPDQKRGGFTSAQIMAGWVK